MIKEKFRNILSNILIKLVQIEEEEFKFEKCKRQRNFYPLHKQANIGLLEPINKAHPRFDMSYVLGY